VNAEQKIIQALGGWDEASAATISRLFFLPIGLYPALLELEERGIIKSRWEDRKRGPWRPRRRLYSLATPFDQAKRLVDHRAKRTQGE